MTTASLSSHSKPGSFAGYVFQLERALAWLADGNLPLGAKVGIETDDDVAVRVPGGADIREQDKHAVDDPPFTNGSEKLWQPLLNWLEAVTQGTLDLDTVRLFLVTNQRLPDGCLALLFTPDPTPDAVQQCVDRIREYGAEAQGQKLKISSLVGRVLAHDESTLRKLLGAVVCLDARQGTVGDALRSQICSRLQMLADDQREPILNELAGWVQHHVQGLIRAGKPAWITRETFLRQYRAIQGRLGRQRRRERSEALIPLNEGEKDAKRGSTFVRQLELIDADDEEQLDAIADFLRSNIERSRLTAEGDITATDWESFDTNIHKFWKNNQRQILKFTNSNNVKTEEQLGHEIYSNCLSYREFLAGEPTQEYYLTRGTFHRQADKEYIGWHPRYSELLKKSS